MSKCVKEFNIYGEITGETLKEFSAYAQGTREIVVNVNSSGGEVFSALAISNLLKARESTVKIMGLCASAATLLIASSRCVAVKNALIMVHLPLVGLSSYYNESELAKVQETLSALKSALVATYSRKVKKSESEIEELLKAEKWMSAREACELGLVDEVSEEEVPLQASQDKKILYVNKESFTGLKLPEGIRVEETKSVMTKYKNSILTAERLRCANLRTLENGSAEVRAIVESAIASGAEYEEVKQYVNAVKSVQEAGKVKNLDELYKLISDNLSSGSAGVTGGVEEEKASKYTSEVAEYLNEILKGGKAREV